MQQSRSGPRRLTVLAAVIAVIAAACGGSTTSNAPSAAASAAAPSASAAAAGPSLVAVTPAPIANVNGAKVVRWFIGLGTGGKPDQLAAEFKVANDFNAAQKEIYLSVEVYDNKVAAQQLQIEIAAGNPPDIIGPVGGEGL